MEDATPVNFEDFAKLQLKVATIVEAEPHPNADRLLKLQIDLGDERRQICAGIRAHYDCETLVGRQIVVVANLAPRTIRGEVSSGMLLAASVVDGDEPISLALLAPDQAVPAGAPVG